MSCQDGTAFVGPKRVWAILLSLVPGSRFGVAGRCHAALGFQVRALCARIKSIEQCYNYLNEHSAKTQEIILCLLLINICKE